MREQGKKRAGGLLALVGLVCLLLAGCQPGGEAQKEGEEVYEVVMETITFGEEMEDLSLVEEAVSAISVPAIGCSLKLLPVPIADHEFQIPLMSRQKKKLDLINTGRTLALTGLVEEGLLLPLNELLPQWAPELYEKEGRLLEACVIGGKLYAVPASLYCGSRNGFLYNADLARELGLTIPQEMDLGELEALAARLKEEGIYLTSMGSGADSGAMMRTLFPGVIPVDGSQLVTGASMEETGESVLRNVYDTSLFMDYCLCMRRWKEEGYIPADSLYVDDSVNALFLEGRIFFLRIPLNPIELALQKKNYPFTLGQVFTGPAVMTTFELQENGWGISSGCERPEKALAFLNLVYSNAEVANLLMNGIEGREYVRTGERVIARVPGQEGGSLGYARYFSVFGDQKEVWQWEPTGEAFVQELEEFYQGVEPGPFFGYTFDVSPVSAEYQAVSRVLASYLPALDCGLIRDVEGAVTELRRVLDQAGIQRILQENQRQLRLWSGMSEKERYRSGLAMMEFFFLC